LIKWQALPGPARYIEEVIQHLRDGTHVVIAAPVFAYPLLERAFVEHLAHERWYKEHVSIDSNEDPLRCLTEKLYLEPEQWIGWSVEKLFSQIRPHYVIVIDGVTAENWDQWRLFLQEFEAVSRHSPSDERPVLLTIVRGVSQKRLQTKSVAATTIVWSGVFGELDALTYVDQQLRAYRKPARHHKLMVRQIAALALWDLELADYLVGQPEREVFNISGILKSARKALGCEGRVVEVNWESGGSDNFDGVELLHPFALLELGDPTKELNRRVWGAQASELLPLIEMRRRELARSLERHIPCPFWIDGTRQVGSLDELEIGSLAYATKTQGVKGELRDKAEWLASCRNTLAHLSSLDDASAMDSRLHG